MAEETLVESRIEDSIKLIRELDSEGLGPSNALWYFFSDAEEWRLLIAGKDFDQLLPRDEAQAYQKAAKAIGRADLASVTIADVKLVRTDHPLVKATKFFVGTSPTGLVRAHFRDNTFNGVFVKEMLSYELHDLARAAPDKGCSQTRPALQLDDFGGTQPGVCVQVARGPRAAAILLAREAGRAAELPVRLHGRPMAIVPSPLSAASRLVVLVLRVDLPERRLYASALAGVTLSYLSP